MDPLRRLALDQKLRVKKARAERYKAYDAKRKNMVEELEERERAFKKAKVDKKNEEIKVQMETERIKEEGRKLREQKEKEMRMREEERTKGDVEEEDMDLPPELRMFFSFGSGFVANLFYRPTRYNYSSKIFIEGSPGAHDTRSYSQATIAIRSP